MENRPLPAVYNDVHRKMDALERQLRIVDGPLAISNATVPDLTDVGDDLHAIPWAKDLGYPDSSVSIIPRQDSVVMLNGDNWDTRYEISAHSLVDLQEWT